MREMSRGISTIIAAILLLIITIGLAGTAYLFITRIFYAQTSKTIQLLDATCTNGVITLVVSNQGTDTIGDGELTVYINEQLEDGFGGLDPLNPHDTKVQKDSTCAAPPCYTDSVNIRVTSPSNTQTVTIWC